MEKIKEIFILMADVDGTMRSQDEPIGVAVTTEKEAKQFVKENKVGYTQSYMKLMIFEKQENAINWKYHK